jgi:hypothetical protein
MEAVQDGLRLTKRLYQALGKDMDMSEIEVIGTASRFLKGTASLSSELRRPRERGDERARNNREVRFGESPDSLEAMSTPFSPPSVQAKLLAVSMSTRPSGPST